MKTDVRPLIRAHVATMVDVRTDAPRMADRWLFVGVPVGLLSCCIALGVDMSSTAAAGLLTVTGILGAFLFGVMLQVSERAMTWADSNPQKGPATSRHALFLQEIAANAGYASLVATAASIFFVVASVTSGTLNSIAASMGIGIGIHAILVLLMVIVRIYALTADRLTAARTGAGAPGNNVTDIQDRRAL